MEKIEINSTFMQSGVIRQAKEVYLKTGGVYETPYEWKR